MPVRVGGSWPSITALLSAQGPEDTNYEPEDMNNEEIERAAKLSVRKSAPLDYYCASAFDERICRNSRSNDQRTTSGGEPAERPEKHGTMHSRRARRRWRSTASSTGC